MCGRLSISYDVAEVFDDFEAAASNDLPEIPNYNVCPTTQIAVVTSADGVRRCRPMRWGFIPDWYKAPNDGPLLINARAETIAEKPAFRAACRARRCLIPVSGFYEWTREKKQQPLPWYIASSDGQPTVLAAIWQDWEFDDERIATCAIVTTNANTAMGKIHHRMPVIVTPENWALWLGEKGKGAAPLMVAAPEDALLFQRVSTEVNANNATGATLITSI